VLDEVELDEPDFVELEPVLEPMFGHFWVVDDLELELGLELRTGLPKGTYWLAGATGAAETGIVAVPFVLADVAVTLCATLICRGARCQRRRGFSPVHNWRRLSTAAGGRPIGTGAQRRPLRTAVAKRYASHDGMGQPPAADLGAAGHWPSGGRGRACIPPDGFRT
jgi:hypothetical protein